MILRGNKTYTNKNPVVDGTRTITEDSKKHITYDQTLRQSLLDVLTPTKTTTSWSITNMTEQHPSHPTAKPRSSLQRQQQQCLPCTQYR